MDETTVNHLLGDIKHHIQTAFLPDGIISDANQSFTSGVTDYTQEEKSYADALRNHYTES